MGLIWKILNRITIGWRPFIGLGLEVTDVYMGETEETAKKHIWILLYVPFVRIGVVL